MWRTSLPAHVPVCKGYRLPTVSKWMRTIKACPVAQQGRCNTLGCLEMSKSWLTYCRYPWNGHQHTQTHTHLVMTVIYFHWYKVWSVQWMFTACSLFWVCFTQQQLWCLKKEFPLVFLSLCMCVCECRRVCACEHVLAGRHVIDSSLHLQAISGLRSHRPCKQPQASFPASFTCYTLASLPASLSTLLPPSFGFSTPSSSG